MDVPTFECWRGPLVAPLFILYRNLIPIVMKEEFIHFLWRTRRFDQRELRTTHGHALEIIHPGEHNVHAGPDFFNARLRIDGMEWAGNVEMHLASSDWYVHQHEQDPAYAGVILHVVWVEDSMVLQPDGRPIPCLELCKRVSMVLLEEYERLMLEEDWLPCGRSFQEVPGVVRLGWLDRLLVERLEQKTVQIERLLEYSRDSWEDTFYYLLARSFGLKINLDPFEQLARSLSLSIVQRHREHPFQIEALYFGQAGFLEREYRDNYPNQLAKEYQYLRHKYQLVPMEVSQWKFLRLRPANFPTIRIAQFAALMQRTVHLFSKILECRQVAELEALLTLETAPYWETHYRFDVPSVDRKKAIGRAFLVQVFINTVVPVVFFYGKRRQEVELQNRALAWLEELGPESNQLIEEWVAYGVKPQNAHDSQALLQLRQQYCLERRCLDCAVGHYLLR